MDSLHVTFIFELLIHLLFFRFIPESVRWLRITNQTDKAMTTLRKVAKFNKKEFPDVILKPVERPEENKHGSLLDIFRPCRMAIKSVIQGYTWFVFSISERT